MFSYLMHLEKKYGSRKKFKKNRWKYGECRVIEGKVVEKGGVAVSNVIGKLCLQFGAKYFKSFFIFRVSF